MFVTTVLVAALLGAVVSSPVLTWGRRLDRRRMAAIESRSFRCLAVLVLLLLNLALLGVFLAGQLLVTPVMVYATVATIILVRWSDSHFCRAALHTFMTVVLLILLADLADKF